MNNECKKKFTPKYDTDLIPKWYFDENVNNKFFIIGEVKSYMGANVPEGWLLCDGSVLSRNHYKDLFNVIGTEYGVGDGISTFSLPTIVDSDSIIQYKIIKY